MNTVHSTVPYVYSIVHMFPKFLRRFIKIIQSRFTYEKKRFIEQHLKVREHVCALEAAELSKLAGL